MMMTMVEIFRMKVPATTRAADPNFTAIHLGTRHHLLPKHLALYHQVLPFWTILSPVARMIIEAGWQQQQMTKNLLWGLVLYLN